MNAESKAGREKRKRKGVTWKKNKESLGRTEFI